MRTNKTSNFVHYNPNPEFNTKYNNKNWNRGDCVIRAVCGATGLDWETVFIEMCKAAMKVHDMPNCKLGEREGFKALGFIKGESVKPQKGGHWPLVKEMAKKFKDNIIICSCCGHVVCCKNGNFYDTWDCGNYTVREYWVYNK